MVILPTKTYFESIPPDMDEDPKFDRHASLAEITAYQELVDFAHKNIPLPDSPRT